MKSADLYAETAIDNMVLADGQSAKDALPYVNAAQVYALLSIAAAIKESSPGPDLSLSELTDLIFHRTEGMEVDLG